MKRKDSILLKFYTDNLPKAQNGLTLAEKNAVLAYMQGLKANDPKPKPISPEQSAAIVNRINAKNPGRVLVATNTREAYEAKRKEKYAPLWEAEEREAKRLKEERAAAAKTREKVIRGDENATFTFPDGVTKKWKDMGFREQQYVVGKNMGSWNNDNWTDWINPIAWIGSMGEGLATAPYVAKKTDSYLPYVTGVGAPLLTGAFAGAGTKGTGQFVENIVNPLPVNLSTVRAASQSALSNISPKLNKLISKIPFPLEAAKKYIPGFAVKLNKDVQVGLDFINRTRIADNTIREEGNKFVNRLLTPEGQSRLRNQFKIADPNLTDEQLDWLVQTRINEVNNAAQYNSARFYLEHGQGKPGTLTEGTSWSQFLPMQNAHFSGFNFFPNMAVQRLNAPSSLFPMVNKVVDNSTAGITSKTFNLAKDHPFVTFTDPHYNPGTIALGAGYELNKNVARHELAHSLQASGAMPVDMDLLEMIKPKNTADMLWRAGVRLDPQLKKDLNYFVTAGGRSVKNEPYPFLEELRNRLLNRGIIKDEYEKITPLTLARARLDALRQVDNNVVEGTRLLKFIPPWKYGQLSKIMNTAPAVVPVVGGAGILAGASGDNQKKKGGPIVSSYGQWAYPGKVTRIPASDITMQGVPYPVFAIPNKGKGGIMYPGENYVFPEADYVDEYPMMKSGGQHGGLDRWFAEKWVDVKTGKACGRQEGESRAYPACRPSRRVSSQTPKTSSEMSPSEKAKFKRTKTSSERIPYNHKRK